MRRVVTFVGVPSGDGECLCWLVDKATYIRISGGKPTQFDRGSKRGTYMLYPGDVIKGGFFQPDLPLKVRVSITGKKNQIAKNP